MKALDKVIAAATQDPTILTERGKEETTFGNNPQYLLDTFGITKSDLIRLERAGMAMKARYVTKNKRGTYFPVEKQMENGPTVIEKVPVDGEHRVRWLLFKKENA